MPDRTERSPYHNMYLKPWRIRPSWPGNKYKKNCWLSDLIQNRLLSSDTFPFWRNQTYASNIRWAWIAHFRQSVWNIKIPIFGIHRIPQYHVSVAGGFLGWQIYRRPVELWRPSMHPFYLNVLRAFNEQNKPSSSYLCLKNAFSCFSCFCDRAIDMVKYLLAPQVL